MFSVIIPLYNKELSVKNTILSVLDQTYQDFEIIVVNDGSTDKSAEIVADIKDSRIIVYNKVNGGVSSARNFGINKAKYGWVAFLDGDDLWKPNHLQIVNEMINQFPHERLFATSFDYSNNRVVKRIKRKRFSIINEEDYFEQSIVESLIWTSVFIAHKDCFFEDLFLPQLALGEDLELFSRLLKKYRLVKANDITAIYRVDAENRSSSHNKYRMNKSFLSVLNFSKMRSIYEKKYFKKLIIQKLKYFILQKDLKNVIYIIKRYNINLI